MLLTGACSPPIPDLCIGSWNGPGMPFAVAMRVINESGRASTGNNGVEVKNADAVTVIVTVATAFENYQDISGDAAAKSLAYLEASTGKRCHALRADHLDDYQATFDPNHQAAGYPLDCTVCHTTMRWLGAQDVNHDPLYFPIYSGEHRDEWNQCTDCHINSNDFGAFECINCHEHNQSEMADEHDDVNGYQWASTACLQCHPNGDEGDRIGLGSLIGSLQRRFPELRPPDGWRTTQAGTR